MAAVTPPAHARTRRRASLQAGAAPGQPAGRTIATHEWRDIARDVAGVATWRERWSFLLRGPGWAYGRRAELLGRDAAKDLVAA